MRKVSAGISKIPQYFSPGMSSRRKGKSAKKSSSLLSTSSDCMGSPGDGVPPEQQSPVVVSKNLNLQFTPTLPFREADGATRAGEDAHAGAVPPSPTAESLLERAGLFGQQLLEKLHMSEKEVESLVSRNRRLSEQVAKMEKANLKLEANLINIETKHAMMERVDRNAEERKTRQEIARHASTSSTFVSSPPTSPSATRQCSMEDFSPAHGSIDAGAFMKRISSELQSGTFTSEEKKLLTEQLEIEKFRADKLAAKFEALEAEKREMETILVAAQARNAELEDNLEEQRDLLAETQDRIQRMSTTPRSAAESESGLSLADEMDMATANNDSTPQQLPQDSPLPESIIRRGSTPSDMSGALDDKWYTETFREELRLIENSSSNLFDDSTPPTRIEKQSSIRKRLARASSSTLRQVFRESRETHGHYEPVEAGSGFVEWLMCCAGRRV